MIVNFRICKINRDTRKLTRTSTLIKKKKPSLFVTIRIANHMIEYYKVFESAKKRIHHLKREKDHIFCVV
jgi:hypothetical protein